MNGARLYFRLIQLSLLARMQYRADFIVGMLGVIAWNVASLGLIAVLISRFTNLNNWTLWELVFLYCLWMLGHSLYSLFFSHIRQLEDYLIEGTFDQFLLRPTSPLIQILGREFQSLSIADMLIGLTGISLAYNQLGLHWDGWKWGFFISAMIFGALIELTLNLIIASAAFWTGRARAGFAVASQFEGLVQQYPVDIFGNAFRVIVTGILPVAFMNYYPSLILLGKLDRTAPGWWLSYITPVVVLLLVGAASLVWRLGLRRYSSSGS